jgi:CBS domain-containing protein
MTRLVAKRDISRDIPSADLPLTESIAQFDSQTVSQGALPPVALAQYVADVMTPNPVTVTPGTPLAEVIAIFAQRHISGLPVIDQANRLVGVISEADLLWQITGMTPPTYITVLDSTIMLKNPLSYGRDLHRALGQTVAEVMTSPAVSVGADATLPAAAGLLHERRRLPVVDGAGHLVGIITRGDIIRTMAAGLSAVPITGAA